jgi:hypothetical protein
MSVVNGSNHQSPRAAASAARKLLDTVGEEHSDTKETSSSSDLLYSISTGNDRNSATDHSPSNRIVNGKTVDPGNLIYIAVDNCSRDFDYIHDVCTGSLTM